MIFPPRYGILFFVMGLRRAQRLRFRLFCHLLAAFWVLSALSGVVQMAACCPVNASASIASPGNSAHPMCHCAMCRSEQRRGMPCCCHRGASPGQQAKLCARCDLGKPGIVAALIWSTPALPPAVLAHAAPRRRLAAFPVASPTARSLPCDLFPRPPCLL